MSPKKLANQTERQNTIFTPVYVAEVIVNANHVSKNVVKDFIRHSEKIAVLIEVDLWRSQLLNQASSLALPMRHNEGFVVVTPRNETKVECTDELDVGVSNFNSEQKSE